MFELYNPNPHGKRVGDCVVRAVSKALGQEWGHTYLDLSLQGYVMGDILSSNPVWGAYLKSRGFKRDMIASECPECYTLSDFCREYPEGTFVVGTGSHAICIIDGVIYDAWDSSDETPLYFFKKEDEEDVRTE